MHVLGYLNKCLGWNNLCRDEEERKVKSEIRSFRRFTISCERYFPALKLIKTMNFHVCLLLQRKLNQTSPGDSFIIWSSHTGTHTFSAAGNEITSMHIR